MPSTAPAAGSARSAARRAWRGLIQVLAGPDTAPAWWHPPWQRRAYVALSVTTLVLCVVNLASMHAQLGVPPPPFSSRLAMGRMLLAVAVVVVPLLLAARYPLMGWRIGWLALLLAPLVPGQWWGGWPWGPAQVLVLLVVFCVAGVRYRRPVLWWMWALSLIPWWLWLAKDLADLNGPRGATIVFTAGTIALESISSRWRTQRDLAVQTEHTELERARRAVLEERTRIAREMHDVVAHHLSLMAIQAGSAPYRLTGLPDPACEEFSSLSQAARAALADMRRLLGALRSDQPAEHAPQPQLADLAEVAAATRRAGVTVELSMPGAFGQVPRSVGVCAYRIVQEALSNAGRHAPGAAVRVNIGQDGGHLCLQVTNGPGAPAQSPPVPGQPGHGLAGMRERVALLGGSLSAGPAADGGFAVSAVLPLGTPTS
jgi:signal transduction histidine kinase